MRMTVASWNMIHHFKMIEFNEPMQMDQDLLFKLDAMREWVGRRFIIHASYATDGHSTDSMHYHGKAVDGHFVDLSAVQQFFAAEQFNWGGLGFYSAWNYPGIHVDTRSIGSAEKAARWWRDERGLYHSVDLATIAAVVQTA